MGQKQTVPEAIMFYIVLFAVGGIIVLGLKMCGHH